MSAPLLADLNDYAMLALVIHWGTLWLGLYLICRRPRSGASVLIGVAFVCVAAYLLEVAYFFIPTTVRGVALREQWLARWCIFAPPLFLHGFIRLTGFKVRGYRQMLVAAYLFALFMFVGGFFSGVFSDFDNVTLDADRHVRNLPVGRYYWVLGLQVLGTALMALAVLVGVRFARPAPVRAVRRQLGLIKSGMALMIVTAGLLYVNALLAEPVPAALLFPLGMIGAVMVTVPLVRYSGRLGGQLLRHDSRSSVLTTVLMLTVFLAASTSVGMTVRTVAATGWLVVAVIASGGELMALTDRVFYRRAGRTARSGLRMAEAYAGISVEVEMDAIGPGGSGEVVGYLVDLDRVSVIPSGLGLSDEGWRRLLAREEFAPVRDALDIPSYWRLGDPLSRDEVRQRMADKLAPRERQALGFWYLGYSDKEMARLMGVKPGVPRSYLNEGKKKLGLSAGPALTLFVYLAGFMGTDAVPLLQSGRPHAQAYSVPAHDALGEG